MLLEPSNRAASGNFLYSVQDFLLRRATSGSLSLSTTVSSIATDSNGTHEQVTSATHQDLLTQKVTTSVSTEEKAETAEMPATSVTVSPVTQDGDTQADQPPAVTQPD